MWRWTRRIVMTLLVLALLAAAAVQAVLWSDIPRRVAIDLLQRETGLRVEIDELRSGWSGRSLVRGVRVSLPDEAEPFATAAAARIEHTALLPLIFGGDIELLTARIDKLSLKLREDEAGRWNVDRIAGLTGGRASGAPSAGPGPLARLSRIVVADASVEVIAADGRRTLLTPVGIEASAIGPAALRFAASITDGASFSGRVVMRGEWGHEVEISVDDAHALAGDWLSDVPSPAGGSLRWTGRIAEGGLRGNLHADSLRVGQYAASGALVAALHGGGVTLAPRELRVDMPSEVLGRAIVRGGELRLDADGVSWKQVTLIAKQTAARLDGDYAWRSGAGGLRGEWASLDEPQGPTHQGRLEGTLVETLRGIEVKLTAGTSGAAGDVRWDGDVRLSAAGASWTDLDFSLDATRGEATIIAAEDAPGRTPRGRRIALAGMTLRGHVTWPIIDVHALRHRLGGPVTAVGRLNADSMEWEAKLSGESVELDEWIGDVSAVTIAAHGDMSVVHVRSAVVDGADYHIEADGSYAFRGGGGSPLSLNVKAAWGDDPRAPVVAPDAAAASAANGAANGGADTSKAAASASGASGDGWAGRVRFDGRVTGRVGSTRLRAEGTLRAEALRINGRPMHDLTMPITATVNDNRISATSQPFDVLDGRASVQVQYARGGDMMRLTADLTDVSLQKLLPLIDPRLVMKGRTSGELTLNMPPTRPQAMRASGTWRVDAFQYADLAFERLTGRLRTRRAGVVELDTINLVQQGGQAEGSMVVDLREGVTASARLRCRDWPVEVAPADLTARLTGDVALEMDVLKSTATGSFQGVTADTAVGGQSLGVLNLSGQWDGKVVTARLGESGVLGGTVTGEVTLTPGKWLESKGSVSWRDIEPARLRPWLTQLDAARGGTSGQVTFGPASARHAPEPMQVGITVEPTDALTFRRVTLGPMTATVYAGPRRWLLDEMKLALADGEAWLWASVYRRGDEWRDHLQLKLRGVNLNELRHALEAEGQDGKPAPGRLTVDLNLYGKAGDWPSHVGDGTVRLAQSNLVNTDIVGSILTVMGVQQTAPTGGGFADVRFERGVLTIDRFIYRNGATEVLMNGAVLNVNQGLASPIRGRAIGTLRPLRNLNLPGLDDVDRLLRAVQSNVATVRIRGTLAKPTVEQATAAEVLDFIERELRMGD